MGTRSLPLPLWTNVMGGSAVPKTAQNKPIAMDARWV